MWVNVFWKFLQMLTVKKNNNKKLCILSLFRVTHLWLNVHVKEKKLWSFPRLDTKAFQIMNRYSLISYVQTKLFVAVIGLGRGMMPKQGRDFFMSNTKSCFNKEQCPIYWRVVFMMIRCSSMYRVVKCKNLP